MKISDWFKFIVLGGLWGTSFLWIKIAVEDVSPFTLAAMRVFFAVLALVVVILVRKPRLPGAKYWLVFAFLGFFNVALPFALISWSEQYIDSGMASILNSTMPLFTIVIAHFFVSDDRISLERIVGLLVGFAGVVVLMMGEHKGLMPEMHRWGQIGMLVAAFSYSVSTVFARRMTRELKPDVQSFGQQAMGLVFLLPFVLVADGSFTLPSLPLTWVALIWLGVLNTALATLLYFSLLNGVGPTRTALVTYIFPLIGVLLGIIFLQENPGWNLFLGGAMIISGIVVVNSHLKNLSLYKMFARVQK